MRARPDARCTILSLLCIPRAMQSEVPDGPWAARAPHPAVSSLAVGRSSPLSLGDGVGARDLRAMHRVLRERRQRSG